MDRGNAGYNYVARVIREEIEKVLLRQDTEWAVVQPNFDLVAEGSGRRIYASSYRFLVPIAPGDRVYVKYHGRRLNRPTVMGIDGGGLARTGDLGSTTTGDIQIKDMVKAMWEAEFPGEWNIVDAVVQCESGWRAKPKDNVNDDGSHDRGLFQINDVHQGNPLYGSRDIYDPRVNTEVALSIRDTQGWTAWACYDELFP
jgi:hypothetical protein